MKNIRGYLLFFLVFISICIQAESQIPDRFIGTYVPEEYCRLLLQTKSHIIAAKDVQSRGTHLVIAITSDTVYSNSEFHDQFALSPDEISHNFDNYYAMRITDQNGHIYRKISDSSDYYKAMSHYYGTIIFAYEYGEDKTGYSIKPAGNGNISLNGTEYELYFDILGRDDIIDVIYNRDTHQCFGLRATFRYLILYEIENSGYLTFDINEMSMQEIHRFYITPATGDGPTSGAHLPRSVEIIQALQQFENSREQKDLDYLRRFVAEYEKMSQLNKGPGTIPVMASEAEYYTREKNIIRNIYYALGNYYFDFDLTRTISLYAHAFKYCLSNKNMVTTPENRLLNIDWIDEGKDNAPCYYVAYNLACAYALQFERSRENAAKEAAFEWLKLALVVGYPHHDYLYRDTDIKVLRDEYPKEFKSIVR